MDSLFSPAASINDIEHFKSIPWCARHLAAPNLIARRPSNRKPGPNLGDGLYGVTLNTPYTIPSMLIFYPDPDATSTEPQSSVPEVKTLITLGPLVSGFAGVCHGGIVMTLLDEVLSILVQVNWKRGAIKGNTQLMTAYLNTTFSKPVTVPGTYLVTARLGKVEGRKAYGSVWIEDGNGTMLTKAEGLFVMVREKL
ncbi:hypothetical protein VMCG_06084 [Cytospora schulzeri]|uniref:Thioesterase domain-containing protein n=1 Tax=Cytospora schulzeri TaxID=448051 RepID=A0A423WGJ0_9PEZI|nr:hypothetical protein VMCG_06084 [Valsa malicola]